MVTDSLNVIVLNYNDADTVISYVKSIESYRIIDHIVIVDNASTDNSMERLSKIASDKIVVVNSGKNGGYGYGNNYGINFCFEKYSPKYMLITNPDVEYDEDVLYKMIEVLDNDDNAAIVAPMMKDINGNVEFQCVWKLKSALIMALSCISILERRLNLRHYKNFNGENGGNIKKVDAVAGSMLMVKSEKMKKYGMYDENMFLYCEESLLGIKMKRARLNCYVIVDCFFIHRHGVSISKSIKSEKIKFYMITKNRKYLVKKYLTKNPIIWFLCDLLFAISVKENDFFIKKNKYRQ